MPDNPRFPEHHSDIPSSRHSEFEPNPASPSPGKSYQSDPQQTGGNPPTKVHVKNLLIGGVITILTSTIVFYITQIMNRKSDTSEFSRTKDITVAAWKSYMSYENVYTKNMQTYESAFYQNGDFSAYITGMKTESAKFSKDVTDLAATQKMDNDLAKILNRRLVNEKSSIENAEKYFMALQKIVEDSSNNLKHWRQDYINQELQWNDFYKGMYQRSVNDIKEIAGTLTERYKEPFSLDDFLVVQLQPQRLKTNDSLSDILRHTVVDSAGHIVRNTDEAGLPFLTVIRREDIIGAWDADGQGVSFTEKGKMSWTLSTGERASGPWQVEGDKIRVDAVTEKNNKKVTWYFKVSNLTASSLTLTHAQSPYDSYHLVRVRIN